MPTIQFKGKTFVQNHHLSVPHKILCIDKDKSYSKKPSLNDNLVIHGDNLEALKALLPLYANKVKCIYIDPPYNTGNEKWVYNDNVNSPMIQEWLGKIVEKDDMTKHDKWLCMMMPRLKILRELLSEDGAIFISIDDNEIHNLRLLCDEIFGDINFKNMMIIKRGVKNVQKQFSTIDRLNYGAEYILCYSKNPKLKFKHLEIELDQSKNSSWNNHWRGTDRPTMRYELFNIKPETGQWRWEETRSKSAIANYQKMIDDIGKNESDITQEEIDEWYITKTEEDDYPDLLRLSNNEKPEHYIPASDTILVSSLWTDLKPNGASQLKKIFGKKIFDTPKSIDLVIRIIQFICADDKDSIILDSYAGSGTTGHAVLEMNTNDKGNRKFILIEQEDYANEITAERIRKVLLGSNDIRKLNGSFSYVTLGEEVSKNKLLQGKNLPQYERLAEYVFYTATRESIELNVINKDKWFIGKSGYTKVYMIYEPKLDELKQLALTLSIMTEIKKHSKNSKAIVFAPAKYVDDATLQENDILFCQLPFEIYRIVK